MTRRLLMHAAPLEAITRQLPIDPQNRPQGKQWAGIQRGFWPTVLNDL